MLTIRIAVNNVFDSCIELNHEKILLVADLPQKLRDRVDKKLESLKQKNVSSIEYSEKHFLVTHNSQNYGIAPPPEFLKGISTTLLVETIQLLHWYLSPHLRARDPDLIGGTIICCDCGLTQRRGKPFAEFCEFTGCPSHAKWVEIIEGYRAPEPQNELFLAFTKVMQGPQNNLVTNAPDLEDAANKWIQKG